MVELLLKIGVCLLAGLGAGLGTGFAGLSAAAVISPMLITFLGMDAFDAVGIALVSGATSQWTKTAWAETGAIAALPRERLCLVYRQDGAGVMGHAGIYLGDGTVVHAKGHADGVVRERLGEGNRFTHFAIPQGLYDGDAAAPDAPAESADAARTALAQARQALDTLEAALP